MYHALLLIGLVHAEFETGPGVDAGALPQAASTTPLMTSGMAVLDR